MTAQLKVAVLISGGGTTLRNLITKQSEESLPVDFRLVISSKPRAAGLEFAREADIPTDVVRRKSFDQAEEHSDAIFSRCRDADADYVLMGGYLEHVLIPPDFENRVLNTHPSLIPSFCGKGYYGLRVHQAVLDYGAKVTGCTIHFVDNQYDHGPIILQRAVDVQTDDTAETLAQRVFATECEAYPHVVRLLAEERICVEGRQVVISGS